MRPWLLAELNYGHVKAHPLPEVAVLPLGATEPHNLHLPYGTDTFQVEIVADAPPPGPTRRGPASSCCRPSPTAPRPTRCSSPWR